MAPNSMIASVNSASYELFKERKLILFEDIPDMCRVNYWRVLQEGLCYLPHSLNCGLELSNV